MSNLLHFADDETSLREHCRWVGKETIGKLLKNDSAFDKPRQTDKASLLVGADDVCMHHLFRLRGLIVFKVTIETTLAQTDLDGGS